ncbi:hypothetical protein COY62_01785 [bacterium (Candidatus Howlettbacteria) CG_4_10_14_0_8_um_filter_40_9]|nr:MAG: hypothetical protein COY62_01785 [bacterium (Candidatus Howlettbacteria) CG_4_10_14_0_8_um_filter_40_9]
MKTFLKTHYKKIILTVISLLATLFIVGNVLKRIPKGERGNNQPNISQTSETKPQKDCKSDPNPVFTHAFTDLTKISSIGPLGTLTGGSPGRSYITINDTITKEVPVYMPADATLERLVYARRGGENTPGEYGLQFRVSCEVTFMLDHIDRVTEDIQKMAPKEPELKSNGGTYPNVEIKAGTLLGYSDGTPIAKTWDLFVLNEVNPPKFINPERWDWDQANTAVCPYDLYPADLKAQHYKLLGTGGGKYPFTKAEGCGSPSKDVAGTIAGGWFQGDSTDMKGKNLNVSSYVGIPQLSIIQDANKTISFSDWDTKTLPETIKVGQSICYFDRQGTNKWAFLKLVSETQLSTATGDGSCPSAFPESKAEVWER